MPVYPIRKYPDPVLRKRSSRVERVGAREKKILARMAETMYSLKGVGLAGPQVGISEEFVVIDVGEGLLKLVNPVVVLKEGESQMEEGCLSIPGVLLNIKRANKVVVKGLNEKGEELEILAEGLLSHALQHEIDHLQGILIIDRATPKERKKAEPLLQKLKEEYNNFVTERL
ncbi:peptide deformylase [Candidatus Aerophobetes bacterium]|uniref:Peptide deformylase n=1 Tax=Aerophobetes bacterium TaxID=2030807 RepID=A0A7V5HYJ8_UNCAE|nr:peptide deformylase [Candidatus Aerophobetes bacterium]HHF98224.1 peptide deformylase [Candidatus Aerophobetes bacterium]